MPKKSNLRLITIASLAGLIGLTAIWSVSRLHGATPHSRHSNTHREPAKPAHTAKDTHDHGHADDHEAQGHERLIRFSEAKLRRYGIVLDTAAPGTLETPITLPGQQGNDLRQRALPPFPARARRLYHAAPQPGSQEAS